MEQAIRALQTYPSALDKTSAIKTIQHHFQDVDTLDEATNNNGVKLFVTISTVLDNLDHPSTDSNIIELGTSILNLLQEAIPIIGENADTLFALVTSSMINVFR